MKKTILSSLAGAFALSAFVTAAGAQSMKPPTSYQGQWWTHPSGCEYSRAGRPGETMWFLILNTAKKGCPTYISGKTWGGVYKDQGAKWGSRG